MLSKTSMQIIRALIELAKLPPGRFEGARRLAKRIDAPANYLGKSLQRLSLQGLVASQKGFGGGFRLGKSPRQITLYDVVGLTENVSRWSQCATGLRKCSGSSKCSLHNRWKTVRRTHLEFLKQTTIGDLIK
jgi:Rrf2 family protein